MATYYVDPAAGSDSAAGTAFGTAWATTQKAADTVAAGDEVRLCKSATETISAVIDFDTTSGSLSSFIRFVSYAADGSAESDGYTINTTSSIGAIVEITTIDYYNFTGITFDANDSAVNSLLSDYDDGSLFINFTRCVFKDATSDNFLVRGSAWGLYNCEITGAGRYGLGHASSNRGDIHMFGCSIHHNTSHGWHVDRSYSKCINCLVYRNGGDGIAGVSNGSQLTIMNSTFYANTGDGYSTMDATNRNAWAIIGNTFVSNGAYGVSIGSAARFPQIRGQNHHYGNTSGAVDVTGAMGDDLITGDPLFTSTTDGSEDFRPASNSPLATAGINGQQIGAKGPVPGGGGGTVGFAI